MWVQISGTADLGGGGGGGGWMKPGLKVTGIAVDRFLGGSGGGWMRARLAKGLRLPPLSMDARRDLSGEPELEGATGCPPLMPPCAAAFDVQQLLMSTLPAKGTTKPS